MAYDIQISGTYSGRPNHALYLYVRRAGQSGNSSYYAWELFAQRNSGSVSYGLDCKPWAVSVGGQGWNGCSALDFRNTSRITLATGQTGWIGHDGNGNLDIWVDAWHNTAPQVIGNADPPGAWFSTDRIAMPPNAPSLGTPYNQKTTSFTVPFSVGAENGAAITQTRIEWSLTPSFTSLVWEDIINTRGGGISDPSGVGVALTPGTTYYVRARSDAYGIGWSGYSNTVSGTTLPATPPGMTVTTSPSGLSATVTLTPPGGVSGVTQYNVERRPTGTTTVTAASTATTSLTVTGLTPGASYDWRASAVIGGYTSPWTAWTPVLQPNPSTSPGDYFDGSTAATADQTYGWTGTANLSTSTATGVGVAGWMTFADGSPNAATGVVARVTGGLFGSYAARITFTTDQTAAGFAGGTSISGVGRTDVTPGATYVGSIHLNLSKSNRVIPRIVWANTAGGVIGSSSGTGVVLTGGQWQRIAVTAVAPPLAEWASVVWVAAPVTDAGSTYWLGGDTVLMDGAMIALGTQLPYFDGSFADGGGFDYSWVGVANQSPSIREDVPSNVADSLLDPDCPPVPAPPRPPIVLDDCIEEVGVWRRYTVVIPGTEVSDWLDVLPTFILTTFGLAERQVRIRVYANPFNYPISQVDTDTWCAEQIISYLPPDTVMVLDAELQRVFASVAGGPDQAADHLLYGSGGTPAIWPILTCGMSYVVSFDTPLDAPAGNTKVDVELTARSY